MNPFNLNLEDFFNFLNDKKKELSLIIFVSILTFGLGLRLYLIFDRPFHHDESLYSMYAFYEFQDGLNQFYKYNPILHGPLLFKIISTFFTYLSDHPTTARILNLVLGLLLSTIPYFLYCARLISKRLSMLLFVGLYLSPNMIMWSSFVQLDFMVITTMVLGLSLIYLKNQRLKILLALILLSLQFCIKENAYVHLVLAFGFVVYEFFINFFFPTGQRSIFSQLMIILKKNWIWTLLSILAAIFIYCYFYSSGFKFNEGILDGLYRKSLAYWLNQHHEERLAGPFSFHFLILSWYEIIFFLFLFIHLISHLYRISLIHRLLYTLPIIAAFISEKILNNSSVIIALKSFFKLKIPLDSYLFYALIFHSIYLTSYYLLKKKRNLAMLGYLAFSLFFTYSFLGEKVPWLSLYIFIFSMIFFFVEMEDYKHHFLFLCRVIFGNKVSWNQVYALTSLVLIAYYFRLNSLLFINDYIYFQEPIAQVHTTKEFQHWMTKIKSDIETPLDGHRKTILVQDDAMWPALWFFRGKNYFRFFLSDQAKIENFDYVIKTNFFNDNKVLQGHNIISIPLRTWWLPQYERLSWSNFFSFMLYRRIWNEPGTFFVHLAIKKPVL